MTWHPVGGEAIEAVSHEGGVLRVRFRGGREAAFADVPAAVVQALKDSPSPGSFFHRQVRGRYKAQGKDDA